MPVDSEFLDQNLIRSFPFVVNPSSTVPEWLMVDFRAVILEGEFDPSIHTVELAWVARFEDRLRFGFRTNAPDLADQELVFERSFSEGRHVTEFTQSIPLLDTAEERCGCGPELLCNPLFIDGGSCGPELLCNPGYDNGCGDQLLCNTDFSMAIQTLYTRDGRLIVTRSGEYVRERL